MKRLLTRGTLKGARQPVLAFMRSLGCKNLGMKILPKSSETPVTRVGWVGPFRFLLPRIDFVAR